MYMNTQTPRHKKDSNTQHKTFSKSVLRRGSNPKLVHSRCGAPPAELLRQLSWPSWKPQLSKAKWVHINMINGELVLSVHVYTTVQYWQTVYLQPTQVATGLVCHEQYMCTVIWSNVVNVLWMCSLYDNSIATNWLMTNMHTHTCSVRMPICIHFQCILNQVDV